MLIIYHSNCLELFMRLVINIISNQRLSDPMRSEIILVDNKIIAQWMEIKLSSHFGIAANFLFMNIMTFVKKISLDILYPNTDLVNFSQDFLFWKLMEILPKICTKKNCIMIQKYLINDMHQQKLGQFSEKVSNLFFEYLVYRSDWLDQWNLNKTIDFTNNEHQIWQSELWRMLVQCIKSSYQGFNSWTKYIGLIQENLQTINCNKLPKKIFICGIVSIPPLFWKILNLLSKYIDIYFWHIDPCTNRQLHTSSNILDINKNKYKHAYDNLNDYHHKYMTMNNSLLYLWGKIGQDTSSLIEKLESSFIIKAFIIPQQNSMLNILQKNILENKCQLSDSKIHQTYHKLTKDKKRYVLKASDRSISIHVCHNMQREIEILHDNLLFMLSNDPELSPGEIIIMAPDINEYETIIQHVFNNIWHRKIPFVISSNFKQYTHPSILTLLKILKISSSRFTLEEILSILSISSIASKFNISIQEIQLLKRWIIASGIRWGLDKKTMYDLDIPMNDQNTWDFGLRRMLLGYAMNKQDGLWEDIFPYSSSHEKYIYLISRLEEFLNILKKWRNCLNISHTLEEWILYIQDIINDFFDEKNLDLEESKALFFLKNCWIDILTSGIQLRYSKTISIIVLWDILQSKLNKKQVNYRFLPNCINFYNISPMCYVPCKILCCIGMNSDAFPRHPLLYDFNLILKNKRIGDNNIWEQDCYSFLLACLLPKQQLYISFSKNKNSHNNIMDHSSNLVNELLEYLAKKFYLINNLNLPVLDNTKKLRKYLFKQYSCLPFDTNNFVINKTTKSFANEWISAANIDINHNLSSIYDYLMVKLPHIRVKTITFHELYDFYRHPVRMWFQKRLGVFFFNNTQQLINHEPFSIDKKYCFSLNMKMIDYILNKKNVNDLYLESYASGMLPYGVFSKLFWQEEYEKINNLVNQIQPYYFSNEVSVLNIHLKFKKIELIGQLNMIQRTGLIRWKPARLFMKDFFLLWLEHLIYCSIKGYGDSQLFGINNICRFPSLSKLRAQELLSFLISGYCAGINRPLMLLYKSGGIWIHSVFDQKNKTICLSHICQKKARYKLIQTWQGSNDKKFFYLGEYHDPYLRKIIPFHLNEENIENIINTTKLYFLEVLQNRIY